MKVDLGSKQYIELNTGESIDGMEYGYSYAIILNSFVTGDHNAGFDTEEDAFQEGVLAIHDDIQNNIDRSTQKMSDMDMELIMKFFEEVKSKQ